MTQQPLKPVFINERLHLLDALRGFASFGIILVHVYVFSGYGWMDEGIVQAMPSYQVDKVVQAILEILVDTKFITIFSILFGVGFSIQLERAKVSGVNFKGYFLKRMAVLLTIACVHAYLLWFGDIIRYYALCGMLLVLVSNWSNKTILRTAIFFGVFLTAAVFILNGILQIGYPSHYPSRQQIYDAFIYGSFKEALVMNWRIDSLHNFIQDSPITFVSVFGKILLGFWLGRIGFFQNSLAYGALQKKWILAGIFIGIPSSIGLWAIKGGHLDLDGYWMMPLIFVIAGGLILHSFLYISLFIRFFHKWGMHPVLKSFTIVGRMALTNYILQSILCIIIFYGWFPGFKLRGVGPTSLFGISIVVFATQVLFTSWWLSKNQIGPVEWLWKKIVYKKTANVAHTESCPVFNNKKVHTNEVQ